MNAFFLPHSFSVTFSYFRNLEAVDCWALLVLAYWSCCIFLSQKKKNSCSSRSSNNFHAEYLKSYWIASSCSSSSGSCLLQTKDCTLAQTCSPSPLTCCPNPLTKRFNPLTFCLISTSKLLQSTYTLLKSTGMLRGAKAYLCRFWLRHPCSQLHICFDCIGLPWPDFIWHMKKHIGRGQKLEVCDCLLIDML